MAHVPYRLVRHLILAAAVLYCSLLLEAAAGFPMDCAPSASAACRAAEANGQTGVDLVLHEVTSTIAGLGSIAMGVFAVLVLRSAGWGGACGRVFAGLAAAVAVSQTWLGLQTGRDVLMGDELDAPGVLQRVSVLLVCLMLATLLPALRHACGDEHDVDRGARPGRNSGGVRPGRRVAAG